MPVEFHDVGLGKCALQPNPGKGDKLGRLGGLGHVGERNGARLGRGLGGLCEVRGGGGFWGGAGTAGGREGDHGWDLLP
jgi:hypothetical protein